MATSGKKTSSGKSGSSGDVGLNTKKIHAMQNSLNNYIDSVVKNIKVGASAKNIQLAIKGSNSEAEVKKYIHEIDKACEDFLNKLKKYSDKLAEMAAIYKSSDSFNGSKNKGNVSPGKKTGSGDDSAVEDSEVVDDSENIDDTETIDEFTEEPEELSSEDIGEDFGDDSSFGLDEGNEGTFTEIDGDGDYEV